VSPSAEFTVLRVKPVPLTPRQQIYTLQNRTTQLARAPSTAYPSAVAIKARINHYRQLQL